MITSADRALVPQLLSMEGAIDLVIPRGGRGLQALVREHARMPVIYGGIGVCHLFVDESADLARSIPLIHNAKTQAPSVCNALDTVLVHRGVAAELLPAMVEMLNASGVGCAATPSAAALAGCAGLRRVGQSGHRGGFRRIPAWVSRSRWGSLDEALAHIAATARTTRRHPDQRPRHAVRFQEEVDRRRCTSSHTP